MTPSDAERPDHPDSEHGSHGEHLDDPTLRVLRLAYAAAQKFPDVAKRHKKFVGSVAVVSSVLVLLGGIAVARRVRRGESAEQILESLTPDEIERAIDLKAKPRRSNKDGPNDASP